MKRKCNFEQIPTQFKTRKPKDPTGLCSVPPNIIRPLPDFVPPSQIQTDSTWELLLDFLQSDQTLSGSAKHYLV
jgi:hypothetical protein